MITLTHFNVAPIIGLRPTINTFNHYLKIKIKHNFSFTHQGFSNYIEGQHEEDHEEVYDYEHITFLALCFILEFKPFLEQTAQNFNMKKESASILKQETDPMSQQWDLVTQSRGRINEL